ncbi:MAG: phage terminase large subunit [Spongiibacteraceae bacterium]
MLKAVEPELTEPQEDFVFSESRHPGMVAGYGAGKSQAAAWRIIKLALQYPGLNFGFIEPTYDLVRLIAWPRFEGLLGDWGIGFELNKSESILKVENGSSIIFRSADNPNRMVGFEIADAVIDEADTLRPEQAAEVWSKMLARCRQAKPDGAINTLGAVSTPEGFGWMYKTFGRELKDGYEIVRAPTSSNPYLPDGYIDQLKTTYSSAQLAAYLDGQFVNLTSGSVYPDFDRRALATRESIGHGEALHIGMDFNVGKMSAAVSVLRNDEPHFVAEFTDVLDTPSMCALLNATYPGHKIYVYPDASGASRKSVNAQDSDIAALRRAGFKVRSNHSNPAVKDRVAAVNKMIREGRLLVNPDTCPELCEALEQQCYNKHGEPDKSTGHDHIIDGAGYLIAYRYPVKGRTSATKEFRI